MQEDKEKYNIDLANRQIEINEWSYQNKMDTLFIFQILFISLLFLSILFYFKGVGLLGGAFVWYVFLILLFVVGVIIISRAMYSANRVDRRAWSKRRFEGDNTTASPLKLGDPAYMKYVDAVRLKFGTSERCPSCPTGPTGAAAPAAPSPAPTV